MDPKNKSINQVKTGSFTHLQTIHKELFQNIYEFAGETRCINLIKNNFRFVSAIYLNDAIRKIEEMPQNNFDEIIAKYIEMYIAHPFLDGNDRSLRIWLNEILKETLSISVDWNKVNKADYIAAMERSSIRDLEIKLLLKNVLSNKIT